MPSIYSFEVNGLLQGMYINKHLFQEDMARFIFKKTASDGHAGSFDEARELTKKDVSRLFKYEPFTFKGVRYVARKIKADVMREPERSIAKDMINLNDPLPQIPITPYIQ